MFKLFHKKLNKKGFTLAELLIVVAIIAILIAIAIPIYTGLLERAQIGVNTANARSLKGAAIATILGDWEVLGGGAKDAPYASDNNRFPANGWFAEAKFDAQGNIEEINVYMAAHATINETVKEQFKEGIVYKKADPNTKILSSVAGAGDSYGRQYLLKTNPAKPSTVSANGVTLDKSGEVRPEYRIVVYLDELDEITSGASA